MTQTPQITIEKKFIIHLTRNGQEETITSLDHLKQLTENFKYPLSGDDLLFLVQLNAAKWGFLVIERQNELEPLWNHYDWLNDAMEEGLREIARVLAEAGQFDIALNISRRSRYIGAEEEALEHIVLSCVRRGDLESTRKHLAKITSSHVNHIYYKVASILAETGNFNDALSFLKSIVITWGDAFRVKGFVEISRLMQENHHPDADKVYQQAVAEAHGEDPFIYAETRLIYPIQAFKLEPDHVRKSLDLARKVHDPRERARALKKVVRDFAKIDHFDEARAVAETILQIPHEPAIETPIGQEYAKSMGAIGHFIEAFQYHDPHDPEEFIEDVLKWSPAMEEIEPELSLRVMESIVPMIATVAPHWQKIAAILKQGLS